jgi:hypothetical protein
MNARKNKKINTIENTAMAVRIIMVVGLEVLLIAKPRKKFKANEKENML